jgi:hypothetical protein
MKKQCGIILISLVALSSAAGEGKGQVASGGTFALDQTVLAGGGGTSNDAINNIFSVAGTAGQPGAGTRMTFPPFSQIGGFWTRDILAPTAASVSITGRVFAEKDRGLVNAVVLLTDASGNSRTARTSAFGYYFFDDIQAGQTFIVTVSSKRFRFGPQIITVIDAVTDLNFTPLR